MDYQEERLVPSRGPALEFEGKLIAQDSHRVGPRTLTMSIWETRGGALIASALSEGLSGERDLVDAVVVEKGDEQAMRFAVMDFFNWEDRARSMVRKQLKWSLKRRIA